jgi:hypothetical protein
MPFDVFVRARIKAALDGLQQTGDLQTAKSSVTKLFGQVIARSTDRQLDLFREADFANRFANQLQRVSADRRQELVAFLRAHDELARIVVFAMRDGDSPQFVYAMLMRLGKERPTQVDSYSNLAAALALVHDRPLVRNINEARVQAPDPLAIFDYYVANEKSMAFSVRNMPVELLIYVVDTTASIEDMQWALSHYAHDPMVGRRFFDIKYDVDYFKAGAPKRLNAVTYSLPNILQFGGVCADQAYFAASVGKAIGVPTAYASGASAETGHAWVGFLQADRNRGAWNFDVGRYDEFRGLRGMVLDPQTRQRIPDAVVSFTAEGISTKPLDRQNAVALSDAAEFLMKPPAASAALPSPSADDALPAEIANPPKVIRTATLENELQLLKQSLTANPGNSAAWFGVGVLAADGKLTFAQKKEWSDELLRRCGQRYPDFALAIVSPMIATIDDSLQQNNLWNIAFERFQSRFDLAAYIRMQQATNWERQRDFEKAGLCYYDVITRYVNAGPFVIAALAGAEKALKSEGNGNRVPDLYAETWARCQKPADMSSQFLQESNWYRVGTLLEQKLTEARQVQQAAAVQAQLEGALGKGR